MGSTTPKNAASPKNEKIIKKIIKGASVASIHGEKEYPVKELQFEMGNNFIYYYPESNLRNVLQKVESPICKKQRNSRFSSGSLTKKK